ncbi:nitroreductase family protein [Mesorhizobium sp. CA8]|uniref:nitroreductase family protein n=1 Tax=unclassified Mesorhizobium TaxID=325217 RepID=UPI001CCF7519|nr:MULTISPECIES: nitroreductase family protein [unclassified Mesorhizobium]MBZ9764955.1 nitroreductase family protein [Mesorhizobium sp. CA8]MBZ9823502.1 nitroreductase family protein [Mesorhizobium sp. CA4]
MGDRLTELLALRFGCEQASFASVSPPAADILAVLAGHRVHRGFHGRPVPDDLVRTLVASALSAPSKSDLQQRDIVIVDRAIQQKIADRVPQSPWVRDAPRCVVFCANGRRLFSLFEQRNWLFPNDHFDLFFNSIGDAAITLAWFIVATEAVGLAGCPLSEIRNFPEKVSEWLCLPDKVIPFAAYCFGWSKDDTPLTPRLPLEMTVHAGRFDDAKAIISIDGYDRCRARLQPSIEQRAVDRWGASPIYGWSEDKARQYSVEQRAGFGAFVRSKGFSTE